MKFTKLPKNIFKHPTCHACYSSTHQVQMALCQQKLLFLALLTLCLTIGVSSHNKSYTTPSVTPLTDSFPRVPIDGAFSKSFGASNIQFLSNGSIATLALDKTSGLNWFFSCSFGKKLSFWEVFLISTLAYYCTGSGLVSQSRFYYGFFSAAIKLPAGLSSGVVVAFYVRKLLLCLWIFQVYLDFRKYECLILIIFVYKVLLDHTHDLHPQVI